MVHHTPTGSPKAFLWAGGDIYRTCSSLVHHPIPELCQIAMKLGCFLSAPEGEKNPVCSKAIPQSRCTGHLIWTPAELRGVHHVPWEDEGGLRNTACMSSKKDYPLLVCLLIKYIKIQFLLPPGFSYFFSYSGCEDHSSLGAPVSGSLQKGN